MQKIRRDDEIIVIAGKDKVSAVRCLRFSLTTVWLLVV